MFWQASYSAEADGFTSAPPLQYVPKKPLAFYNNDQRQTWIFRHPILFVLVLFGLQLPFALLLVAAISSPGFMDFAPIFMPPFVFFVTGMNIANMMASKKIRNYEQRITALEAELARLRANGSGNSQ
jgi:hypothetical protein